jgi:hypothetical protein
VWWCTPVIPHSRITSLRPAWAARQDPVSKNEESVETVPGMGGGGIKENDRGGEFNYDML